MLETNTFVEKLISTGYTHLCTVPCSFMKDLINCSINHSDKFEYLPCASEAVACSVAAGLKLSGKKPIVAIQSSGLTNMGSCITSLLKPYKINFPIIVSWRTYNEGDSEIQHRHLASKLPDLVNAYGYEWEILEKDNLDIAIDQITACEKNDQLCLLRKETFSKVELYDKHRLNLTSYPKRSEFLKILDEEYGDSSAIFIGTTGNTSREMFTYMKNTNNFFMAGNMGGALSLGFGAALNKKDIIVCGGDAEFVMHMGGLTTAGRYKDSINLTYILFDNKSNKSTGGQNTYQEHINYIDVFKSCSITSDYNVINNTSDFSRAIRENISRNGMRVIVVECSFDDEKPRPPVDVIKRNRI